MNPSQLYEENYSSCFDYARIIARNVFEAEDLVQSVFLRAMQRLDLLSLLTPLQRRKWLRTSVKNGLIDIRRKEKREQSSMISSGIEQFDEYDPVLRSAFISEINRFVATLPELYKDVIFKRYWLQMNSKQIGEEMGISASTVRYRLKVAKDKLNRKMEKLT